MMIAFLPASMAPNKNSPTETGRAVLKISENPITVFFELRFLQIFRGYRILLNPGSL